MPDKILRSRRPPRYAGRMVKEISSSEIGNVDEVLLIDVRELQEWDAGHIEGASHLPLSALHVNPALFTPPDDGRPCILYCQRGVRSQKAAAILLEAGFGDNCEFLSLQGGYEAWLHSR